ncbi:Dual specificity protein phosphatase 14 [Toxocara canis]|uniref:Dual specificity protein phosphatase 14 n=1 Tax=Toxocara canis TaxID=6265 RepID=A0A0B2VNF3_TOXCA|nr:Dual specificity protein phosphatase 14 [Toxocara canis]
MGMLSFRVNEEYAQINEVVPGLFVCGVSALNTNNMQMNRISVIINATTEVPNLRVLGNIPRVKLWLEDAPQAYIYPHLELQSDQIEAVIAGGGRVLVHSVGGISRCASICLAFLTKHRCRSLRDAYQLMASRRPMVRPNIGFWRQLIAFEQNVKGNAGSVRLVRDENEPGKLIPDVFQQVAVLSHYQMHAQRDQNTTDKLRMRRSSGQKSKFQPVLEPVLEVVEATA